MANLKLSCNHALGSNSNWAMPLSNAFAGFRLEDNGGHWGVGINAETRELLVAISLLIRCGRVKQALSIIDNELAGGC